LWTNPNLALSTIYEMLRYASRWLKTRRMEIWK
jgi:hypothetical protein